MTRIFKTLEAQQLGTLRKSIATLERRVADREALYDNHINQLEANVGEHEQRLNEVPSTSQIVAGMGAVLSKTMTSLDGSLSEQAHSIDLLKTTVWQTDELLESVLESIDSFAGKEESLNMPAVVPRPISARRTSSRRSRATH